MRLCRVLGEVVSTAKHPGFDGRTLLIVQPVEMDDTPTGGSFLAVDHVQAGVGDRVMVLSEGSGVRQLLGGQPPIRSIIVGVVDEVA